MKRKLLTLMLIVLLLFSTTACSITIQAPTDATTTQEQATTTTTASTTAAAPTTKKKTTAKKTTTKKKTTTTKRPTTTGHQHSYVNYVCSCGAIDKSHSFDYLANWIKTNGTVYADHVFVEHQIDDNAKLQVVYYPETAELSEVIIFFSYEYYPSANASDSIFLTISPDLSFSNYDYRGGPLDGDEYSVNGWLENGKFNDKYPLPYDDCTLTKPYTTVLNLVDDARQNVLYLVEQVGWILSVKNVGLTLADLGFTSFQ